MNAMIGMEWVAVVTAVALLEYLYFVYQVGRARQRHRVMPPAVRGHPEFERCYRVQQNTLEQLAVFLPALWLAGWYTDPRMAATVGIGFVVGRAMYYQAYVREPGSRGPGFALSLAANVVLVLAALGGSVAAVFGL